MKKVLSVIASVVLGCIFLATFAGCSDKISSITDIERFTDMQSGADKIDVAFDNGTQEGFSFTITNEEEIAEIMRIIFNTPISYGGKWSEIPPMGNTNLTIYQGEKTYTLGHRFIFEGENYYSFQTSELAEKITALATETGTFENAE